MEKCSHENCSVEKRVWLPQEQEPYSDISLHPWCKFCGIIKNVSDDKPKKIGYWINILSCLSKRYSLTQSQKHLVMGDLNSNIFFNDMYYVTGFTQKKIFLKAIEKYTNLRENIIDSYIY